MTTESLERTAGQDQTTAVENEALVLALKGLNTDYPLVVFRLTDRDGDLEIHQSVSNTENADNIISEAKRTLARRLSRMVQALDS